MAALVADGWFGGRPRTLLREAGIHLLLLAVAALSLCLLVKTEAQYMHVSAGFRAAWVMVLPRRYWWALLGGEAICFGVSYYDCLPEFGWPWYVVRIVPCETLVLPLLWWLHERLPAFPVRGVIDLRAVFFKAMIIAVASAVYSFILLSLCKVHVQLTPACFLAYTLIAYLGIVAVMPWVVIAWLDYQRDRLDVWWRQWIDSRLLLDLFALLLPALIMLAWFSFRVSQALRPLVELACFLPLAWLSLRYGWRFAATTGSIAVLVLSYTLPMYLDPLRNTNGLALMLATLVTVLLAVGGSVSAQQLREQRDLQQLAEGERLQRQNLQLREQRMRHMSRAVEVLAGKLHRSHARLLHQARASLPGIEAQPYYRHALDTQAQIHALAQGVQPSGWRERGLPGALTEAIGLALKQAGIDYRCHISGRGHATLDPTLLSTAYRVACEAVVHLVEPLACRSVRLQLRVGRYRGRPWLGLRLRAIHDMTGVADAMYYRDERQRIAPLLGVVGRPTEASMRDQAQMFAGRLRVRETGRGMEVGILLLPPEGTPIGHGSRNMRMWVE